jgi:arylformamidase
LRTFPEPTIYDVTVPFSDQLPVWPGDAAIEFRPMSRISTGGVCNASQIVCPTHCGTHVDPPWHFVDDGARLDQIPIERWVGPCQVIKISDEVSMIEPSHLEGAEIAPGITRLLFKTSNSRKWSRRPLVFETTYVALSLKATLWLIAHGIKLVGVDYLSFEAYDAEENDVHRTLLGHDVVAIEGLDLSAVAPGFYQLVCLPLKLVAGDGAPARVVLLSYEPR